MKSIGDFIEGKIVRMEISDVTFSRGGEPDPELGAYEGTLRGPGGEATFYAGGMQVGAQSFAYDRIERVELSAAANGDRTVAIILGEQTVMLQASENGGAVLHATLRWIGHTILRRKIAD